MKIQSSIKLSNSNNSKSGNNFNFNMYLFKAVLLKKIMYESLTLQDADWVQSVFVCELKKCEKR